MIEYLAPSGGGLNNLFYKEVDLIGSDFTKLASQPVTIIPAIAGKKIVPFNVTVDYEVLVGNIGPILIGFEAMLAIQIETCAWGIQAGLSTGDKGIYSQSFVFAASALQNINSQPLILWQAIDNPGLSFNRFKVAILYYTTTI